MQMYEWPYRDLASNLNLNPLYRWFSRFAGRKIPHFSVLNNLIKAISPETMRRVNDALVALGRKKKVEDGRSLRLDTTVTETNISHPCDSRLLWDSVRVLTRTLERLREAAPDLQFAFRNHERACKRLAFQIAMGKGKDIEKKRRKWYDPLLKYQRRVRGYAAAAIAAAQSRLDLAALPEVAGLLAQLHEFQPLCENVYDQAHRRIVKGESVPADEKLLSIFETHTDIICRGKKGSKAEFGHKIAVGTGRSGLVTFYEVLDGNPGDNEVLPRALTEHERLLGRVPERLTGDRRFHSRDNEEKAATAGVLHVALPKPGVLNQARAALQKSKTFRRLMRFRAGIEGNLSTLLRCFGLKRCLWRGWESFQSYVGLAVLAYNLRLLACRIGAL
jgi:IS5 family transposase